MNNNRDLYWDCLKFVLITLVVYGHTIKIDYPDGSFNRVMFSFIYLFHMPLFVFISGRFSQIKDRNKYKSGIIKLLETYLTVQFVKVYVPAILNNTVNLQTFIDYIISPGWTLWYLVSLIYWRIIIMAIPQRIMTQYSGMILIFSCIIGLTSGFIPVGDILSIQRTLAFLPFFILGYYSPRFDIKKYINKIPTFIPIIFFVAIFIGLYFFCNNSISHITHCNSSYWSNPQISPTIRCIERCIYFICAIIMSVLLMSLIKIRTIVAEYGKSTLFIYIGHSFIIFALRFLINKNYLPENELLLFIYAIIITLSLCLLAKIKLLNILLNPISYFLHSRANGRQKEV